MANPTVEKLKVFGIRHGEKLAMGVVTVLFVLCAYVAWSRPAMEITPEDVKKSALSAQENITRKQDEGAIVSKLEQEGVALADFEKVVDQRLKGSVDASKFNLEQALVRLEPGAGLIRDMPGLIAIEEIYAHSGRGAIEILEQDDEGNLKPKGDEKDKAKTKGAPAKKTSLADLERKKKEEAEARRRAKGIAGANAVVAGKKDAEPDEPAVSKSADWETEVRGYRFVTLVGKLDHKKVKELYARALKVAEADPHYLRVEAERQVQGADESWSDWEAVHHKSYLDLKDLLAKEENEYVPTEAIIASLVDPLPFLKSGYWIGAHHASLLPEDVLNPSTGGGEDDDQSGGRAGGGRPGMMGAAGGGGGGGRSGGMAGGRGGGMGGAAAGMGDDGGGMMGGGRGMASGPAQGDFEKSSADFLMVRFLDFDVTPDTVYRYRLRVVVANPNFGWENVAPGVDRSSKELEGPWSEPTDAVNVPADVSTYALGNSLIPGGEDRTKVQFQVAKWSPEDGLTVIEKYDQVPGDIIGQMGGALVPNEKGTGLTRKPYDFTSHQILADAMGGDRPTSEAQSFGVTSLTTPALALVVRYDGMLVLKDETVDADSGEKVEMADIYEQIKKEAKVPKKEGSSSMMYGGGGYGGNGGYGSGGGSGGRGGGGGRSGGMGAQ